MTNNHYTNLTYLETIYRYMGNFNPEESYEVGDLVIDESGSTLMYVSDGDKMWFESLHCTNNQPPRSHPVNCKCCGAILHSWKCEYCGAEY